MSLPVTEHPRVDLRQSSCAGRDGRRWWRWLAVAGYMGLLFFLSAQSTLPELPEVVAWVPPDKLAHFIAYGVLSLLVVWAVVAGQWRSVTARIVVIAIAISSAYGYFDECHQIFVPNRSYDVWDWAADTTGAALAAALARAWSILLLGRSRIHGI